MDSLADPRRVRAFSQHVDPAEAAGTVAGGPALGRAEWASARRI